MISYVPLRAIMIYQLEIYTKVFEAFKNFVSHYWYSCSESPCIFGIGMPETFRVGVTSANMETALFGKVCTDSFDLP